MKQLTTGPILRSVLLMLTSMRNMVTSKAILPGTMSMGIWGAIQWTLGILGAKLCAKLGHILGQIQYYTTSLDMSQNSKHVWVWGFGGFPKMSIELHPWWGTNFNHSISRHPTPT